MFTIIGGDGKEYGPVSAQQIRAWIIAGRADLATKAKAAGSEEWMPLGDFPEFSPDQPPPLAAALDLAAPLASRTSRLGAALLDMAIGVLFVTPGWLLLGSSLVLRLVRGEWPDDIDLGRVGGGLALLGFALLVLFVIQTWMVVALGQTIGKRIAGIRIVRFRDDARPGFLHGVLLRSWLPGLISVIPFIGSVFPLVDVCFIFGVQRRCLHDLMADTKVIVGQPPSRP
jgi:uncharacterized RDD family membrane protein YckC